MKSGNQTTVDLLAAIEKLETFAKQSHPAKKYSAAKIAGNVEETIHSIRNFFTSTFSEREREEKKQKQKQLQRDVLNAIEVLKSNYFLIQKLQEGTPEQQKLAASAFAAIDGYNQTILEERKNTDGLRNRIERFFTGAEHIDGFTRSIIDFPQPVVEHTEFTSHIDASKRMISNKVEFPLHHPSSQKICSFINQNIPREKETNPNDKERDGFIMKGITLIRKHGVVSLDDIMNTIHRTPIQAALNDAIVSLRQIIIPFPGETLELTGEFKRESQSSFPIPHSFKLFSKSIQTGFPHPSQRTGWGLADQLIPAFPQQLDKLLLLEPLLLKKNAIAKKLLPKGCLRDKAKNLLKSKHQEFNQHKEELLDLQLKLHEAIFKASGNKISNDVYLFFEGLKKHTNAYRELSETQDLLLESFIKHPFEKLKSEWIDRSAPGFLSTDPVIRYQCAVTILENEKDKRREELLIQYESLQDPFRKQAIAFTLAMGEILYTPCSSIILQLFSEIIHFASPCLNDFEQKIQLCVYRQLEDFLNELEAPQDFIKNHFIHNIEADLEIFSASTLEEIDHPLVRLVHELEAYYYGKMHQAVD